jgi:hypothetical protein
MKHLIILITSVFLLSFVAADIPIVIIDDGASVYNATYDKWSYNQTGSGESYNATYATWSYNQTDGSVTILNTTYGKYWYNMSDGSYNATYDKWTYNETYSGSTYNATYSQYAYNQTTQRVTYLNITTTTYTGNITNGTKTGYDAVNSICNLTFSGTHMCDEFEVVAYLNYYGMNQTYTLLNTDAWVIGGGPKYVPASNPVDDCNGFTSNSTSSTSSLGNYWKYKLTNGGGKAINCATSMGLSCCK